jgi:hypothetical protein
VRSFPMPVRGCGRSTVACCKRCSSLILAKCCLSWLVRDFDSISRVGCVLDGSLQIDFLTV